MSRAAKETWPHFKNWDFIDWCLLEHLYAILLNVQEDPNGIF